jgi:gluconolactonase
MLSEENRGVNSMEFEVVAEGLKFPEGPVAMPDGSVIFVELLAGKLNRAWGNGKIEVIADLGGSPAGAAIGPDGAIYIANVGGVHREKFLCLEGPENTGYISRVDLSTGRVERLYDRCGEHSLSAPDDLVFDARGNIWFTDIGRAFARSKEYGGLYYCAPDGSFITQAHFPGLSYNGVGLLPGENSVVVADTRSARLLRFDLEAPGRIAPTPQGQSPAHLMATIPGDCRVDSLAVLESGAVAVGVLEQGGIATVRPDGSIDRVSFPDASVTNIAFGGPDMRTAFITLSRTGRVIKVRWPEPGLRLNFAEY